MSDNTQDHGWQIATGRKRKSSSRPVAEVEESAPRSRTSGVEPAASSPIVSPPGPAASQTTNEPLQPTTLPITPSAAETSHASHLSIPGKLSPKKSEKSSVSSSPEKGYLTAPQSPKEGSPSNDVPGGYSDPEEAYISATEQPEEVLSNVEYPQSSSEQVHHQSPSSSDHDHQSKGKERETDKEPTEDGIGEPASSTAESLPHSPDFHTRFLTFPAPEFEGGEESPETDIADEIKEQLTYRSDTEATHGAAPVQIALSAENQTDDKQKGKALGLKQTSENTSDETAQNVPIPTVAENNPEQAQKEKEKDTMGATSTIDNRVMQIGRSVLIPNMPRVVGRQPDSQGDVDSELLTKKAMLELPLSNQHLTLRVHPAPRATMTQRRPSASLSAEAAEFVPMPTIPEVSTSTTPEPPAEQSAPDLPAAAPEIAPELRGFAAYDEQRIRAMAASHPANAATQFLAAPVLHRPVAPVPARLPLPPPPLPPSGESPLGVYDNESPGVPSHWIPLYGSVHGMFYDPLTKLFMGDGAPRPTLHRTDGTVPCSPDPAAEAERAAFPVGVPEDVLHVQRSIFTDPHIGQPYVPANTRFFCWCTGRWRASPHNCPPDTSTIPAGAGAPIRPDTVLPDGWVTHTAPIRDTSYLEAMGLTARSDAQIDSGVQQAWFEAGGGAAAVRGGGRGGQGSSRGGRGGGGAGAGGGQGIAAV